MADVDPLQSFTFMVDANGLVGYFTSVDGLGSEHEVAVGKYITPEGKEVQAKSPGRITWGDVTLKRGITADMGIWEWRQLVVDGKVADARKAVSITLLDRTYAPVVTWNLTRAWPSKVAAMSLTSDSNDFAIEEMTLVHEGITRDGVAGLPAQRGA
jgi:phage tail-like protein